MKPISKIRIIAGDNVFSYILARYVLSTMNISSVVLTNASYGSWKKLFRIYRKCSFQYFIYRSMVQIFSRIFWKYSIKSWALINNIPLLTVRSQAELKSFPEKSDISVAFNFDIIVPKEFISNNSHGVLNIHASNLPLDKGISPVVWAYCRGDREIVVSFYLMNEGIDEGLVLRKISLPVNDGWSLLRTYCEVLLYASKELVETINTVTVGKLDSVVTEIKSGGSYNSWPSSELHEKMKKNKRCYFKLADCFFIYDIMNNKFLE